MTDSSHTGFPAAVAPHLAVLSTGRWMIALNAIDPHGNIIDYPTPWSLGRLFCVFEYYPSGFPTLLNHEHFGFVFEFPTPDGRISPIQTGHAPGLSDSPLYIVTLRGAAPNPELSLGDQQQWEPLVLDLTRYLLCHSPLRLWAVDSQVILSEPSGQWTWTHIGQAEDSTHPLDRPLYRFDGFKPFRTSSEQM